MLNTIFVLFQSRVDVFGLAKVKVFDFLFPAVLVSYCVYTSLVRYLIGIRVLYPPPSFDKLAANFVSHRSVQKTMQQIRDKTENVII